MYIPRKWADAGTTWCLEHLLVYVVVNQTTSTGGRWSTYAYTGNLITDTAQLSHHGTFQTTYVAASNPNGWNIWIYCCLCMTAMHIKYPSSKRYSIRHAASSVNRTDSPNRGCSMFCFKNNQRAIVTRWWIPLEWEALWKTDDSSNSTKRPINTLNLPSDPTLHGESCLFLQGLSPLIK